MTKPLPDRETSRTLAGIVVVAALLGGAGPTSAATPIAEWNDGEGVLEFSGYFRTTSGAHDLDYGEERFDQTTIGLNSATGRLQWHAILGPDVELKLHQELLWSLTSGGGGMQLFGVGASRTSEPTVDLKSKLLDLESQNPKLTHDIDRLAFDIYTRPADITVGRQAITWGDSAVFPVADLWSRFSPYDLDTQQKPGIDAVRVLTYPSMSSELDFVVADRGSLEDLSGGVRGAWTIDRTEVWAGGGKFWRELLAMGGVSLVLDRIKIRGEGVLPWHLDETELRRPRATGGVEWYGRDHNLGGEYHYNGIGVADAADYGSQFGDVQYQRGESYFLGRHYAGIFGSYTGFTELEMRLSAIGNLVDPSLLVAPSIRYEIAQNTRLGVGSFVTAGRTPELRRGPRPARLRSEFGTYGNFYYLELTAHY